MAAPMTTSRSLREIQGHESPAPSSSNLIAARIGNDFCAACVSASPRGISHLRHTRCRARIDQERADRDVGSLGAAHGCCVRHERDVADRDRPAACVLYGKRTWLLFWK